MLEMLEIETRYLVAKQNSCYISSTEWQPRSRGKVVLNGDVKLTIFNISWSNAGASSWYIWLSRFVGLLDMFWRWIDARLMDGKDKQGAFC